MASKRPKLRWDVPMRQALCCLYRFFRCNKKQKEEIFFAMFRENLRKHGIHQFVPGKTLHTQWNWMRNTGDLIWSHVHRNTEFNMDGEWRDVIQRIKSTALTLRLPLIEKTEDDIDTAQWGTRVAMTLRQRADSPPQTPRPISFPLHQRRAEERSHYFAESDDQSSESITMSVDKSQEWADEPGHIITLENNEAVVISHGKTCIWCEHGLAIDETDGPDDWTQPTHLDQPKIPDENQSQNCQGHQDWGQQDYPQGQQLQESHREQQDQDRDQQQEHQGCSRHHHGQQDYHHDHELAMKGVPADKMPPLLFRWSNRGSQGVNSKTGFLAGLFCNGEWFDHEDFPKDRFESFFRSHVTKEKVKTPFISTSHSPLAPLHRAIANQNSAMLTVIDTSKLETKVFYAHPLAIRTRTFTYSWKGYGEYLIWGRIPLEAIAFSVEITSLETIVQSHPDVARLLQTALIRSFLRCNKKLRDMLAVKRKSPFQSGRTLGKLLTILDVPTIHWDNIASRFAKSWGWKYAKETALFHSGLRSAPPYLSEELSDSESEVPWPTPQKTPVTTSRGMPFSTDCISDVDYEPPETDQDSGWTSESEYMDESRSITICDMSETSDDGKFSTHETLSSGMFPENDSPEPSSGPVHHQEIIDLSSDNEDTSSQRALQRDWPSDDEYMYPDTPTKTRGRIPLQSGRRTTDNFVLNGSTDMDFFEKVRKWVHHEN
ncbi:hypothetical protein N7516_004816 [Penicillium verrucosum]|uniref:uncharacterized protein n=1 Tax=Penicillium verrucosum TaxID=60171 RepID=UPI002545B46E|nr:uncharacterized protein N7516_004816 [Penicillium verrucosum]KAJ5944648.1 hypothetical protein N7516_004816 [Penicillium verrucosum]